MAISDGTAAWARRATFGTFQYKNLYNTSFGYTQTHKKVAAASNTAILAATAGSLSSQTVTTGITNPDVPRALKVITGGTAGHINAGRVIVNGVNSEGKVISEAFATTLTTATTINGALAFARVTSIVIDPQLGVGMTVSVGTQNKLGIKHRLFPSNTTVKVYTNTTAYGALTLQGVPTVTADNTSIENNLVLPATTPDGSFQLIICYAYDNWADGTSVNDQPEYLFTTSTSSTSTSTSSTTVTTSTSSTSSSTSSTSTSTSSTSTSTSSTSTSTTTTP